MSLYFQIETTNATHCEEKDNAQSIAQTSKYTSFRSMPPTTGNIANVDLSPQRYSGKDLQQPKEPYSTSNISPNKSENIVVGSDSITPSEARKPQLKDPFGKQKSLLNTYSSEELLLQAVNSLQGLEGKLLK